MSRKLSHTSRVAIRDWSKKKFWKPVTWSDIFYGTLCINVVYTKSQDKTFWRSHGKAVIYNVSKSFFPRWLLNLLQVQFCIVLIHNVQVLFRECDYPKFINVLLAIQAGYFLYMFGAFYNAQYIRNRRKKKPEESGVIKQKSQWMENKKATSTRTVLYRTFIFIAGSESV